MLSNSNRIYERIVHFQDTDAAGVVFFANVLKICHEAYEYSLQVNGFDLKQFFSKSGSYAVPIVHAHVDFLKPMFCGDRLQIHLQPQELDSFTFEINYKITNQNSQLLSIAQTKHFCISTSDRSKFNLPAEIRAWITATTD